MLKRERDPASRKTAKVEVDGAAVGLRSCRPRVGAKLLWLLPETPSRLSGKQPVDISDSGSVFVSLCPSVYPCLSLSSFLLERVLLSHSPGWKLCLLSEVLAAREH